MARGNRDEMTIRPRDAGREDREVDIARLPEGLECAGHEGRTCREVVDVIVTRDQIIGTNQVICVECKIERMKTRLQEKVDKIKSEAETARAELAQLKLV